MHILAYTLTIAHCCK